MSKFKAKSVEQNKDQPHYSGIEELWAIEGQLKNYNKDIAVKISRDFQSSDKVLEFGGGIGSIASIIYAIKGIKPDCVELDPDLRLILDERGFEPTASIEELNKQYDHVYLSNVLEHIEDDVAILKQIQSVLKENGKVVIYSPAFQVLYTSFDAQVGHYRRYSLGDLRKKLIQSNYTVLHYEFVDSLGFFAWILLKFNSIINITKASQTNQISHKSFIVYDRYFYPISKLLDSLGLRYLIGKNILITAQKNRKDKYSVT
jgi:ubiquinone/menaquinone biosynthesis C-methylase UbiE